jgi:hypothetical protein
MSELPAFMKIAEGHPLLHCGTCGAVVDASDESRALHGDWHASIEQPGETIDLNALERPAAHSMI